MILQTMFFVLRVYSSIRLFMSLKSISKFVACKLLFGLLCEMVLADTSKTYPVSPNFSKYFYQFQV